MTTPSDSDSSNLSPSHIIGIGASAGGLEALQEFFAHFPGTTGASIVVIQHLSPDFKSMMPELLGKHTDMSIRPAEDGRELHADEIYLAPARSNVMVAEGHFIVSEQMPDNQLHLPIDTFLRSLAKDQQHKAIAVVLSGTGSDGTLGVKSIKESGGLVVVQDPSSAKFDGMPLSAYRTGLADMMLPAPKMGANLAKFIEHPFTRSADGEYKIPFDTTDDTLTEIFRILKEKSSINFSQYKASTVARRIERRLGINQLYELEAYLGLLKTSPKEIQILSKELLIGVTRFFRDKDAFESIKEDVIPNLLDSAYGNQDIRLWVAGCSTGEEAYSLGMLFDEAMEKVGSNRNLKIFATDVDEDAIAEASSGVYSHDQVQDVSKERLDSYFDLKDGLYVVKKRLRQMIIFATHNMIEDPPFSNIDLASCRNALIYFQHAAQKKVLSSLYFSLKKDGYLFLGNSESLGDMQTHYETINERQKVYLKVSNLRVPIGTSPPTREALYTGSKTTMASASLHLASRSRFAGLNSQLEQVTDRLLNDFAPPSIVLNDAYQALHIYGEVAPYMAQVKAGKVSNNIKDMVTADLSVAISTALHRAEKSQADVFYNDVMVNFPDTSSEIIDLHVLYIKEKEMASYPQFFVVQFISKARREALEQDTSITYDAAEQSQQRIRDLEQELTKKQEHLQVTVEELETTNEELQSANEELMSANEELQSTNEELQSVNEELYTVNSEYQEKINELTEANNDLDNVISSSELGILFLDSELTIRKFTDKVANYINVREADIGRPFHHISHELDYSELLDDVAMVADTQKTVEREVKSSTEHSLWIRIMPYNVSRLGQNEGVYLTITNISRLRFVEGELKRAQEQLRNKVLSAPHKFSNRLTELDKVTVLLVDDDSADTLVIQKMLKNINSIDIVVVTAASVMEAIECAKDAKFDVCFVDYMLGNETATDFVQALEENRIDLPVVILSGYSELSLEKELAETDVFDFLNKEELSSQLIARSLSYVLERRSLQKAFSKAEDQDN